jgi:dTDP-glucose 4,6-dehydratase
MSNMQETVLVTGGCGFIGSNYVRHYLHSRPSVKVLVLDKLTYAGHRPNLQSEEKSGRCEVVVGDIADARKVSELLEKHKPISIVNFAAESHVDRSIDEPTPFLHTNVSGTFTLLEATRHYLASGKTPERGAFRFVHLSTDEVHGSLEPSDPPFREGSTFAPNSPYAASKAAADHLCRAYFRTYGVPTVVLRPSNNFGPYQFPEKLIPLTILRALAGKKIPVYGDGKQVRDWIYVEDTVTAVELARLKGPPGEPFQVGVKKIIAVSLLPSVDSWMNCVLGLMGSPMPNCWSLLPTVPGTIAVMQPTHPNLKRLFPGSLRSLLSKEWREPCDGIWIIQIGVKRSSRRGIQAKD